MFESSWNRMLGQEADPLLSATAHVDVVVLTPDSPREALVGALLTINREARRLMARDNWGRPNAKWANRHEFLNMLLDWIEEAPCPREDPVSAADGT